MGEAILVCLANFRAEGLGSRLRDTLHREIYWPPNLYRDAPSDVAEGLCQRIEEAGLAQPRLNHALAALAWTRGDVATAAFSRWRDQRPQWAEAFYVPPEAYPTEAGWCLGPDGARKELFSPDCYLLVPTEAEATVHCRVPLASSCPGCSTTLEWLFDFSGLPDGPQNVLHCPVCSAFGRFFSRGAAVHPATEYSGLERDEAGNQSSRRPERLPAFAITEPFGLPDASALGGAPGWIQDAQYPNCPECGQWMGYVAQLDDGDGRYYAFFCNDCRVSAVNYQQT
ncbi:MAG: hypothetical protein AB7J86_41430 [Vulcanimicrobiota bacterium]